MTPGSQLAASPQTLLSTTNAPKDLGKHGKTFKKKWLKAYDWLIYNEDEKKMFCKYCKQTKESKVPLWINGNASFREDRIKHYEEGNIHQQAIIKSRGMKEGVKDLMDMPVTVKRTDLNVAFKTMYHLLHKRDPFSHYKKDMDFLSFLKVTTPAQDLPANANLRSDRIQSELIAVIGSQIQNDILDEIKASPCFSLIIDETCDVTVREQLIIYIKYIGTDNAVKTSFVGICEVSAGDASTITSALLQFVDDNGLSRAKITGFGSDGASVMLGKNNGVASRLRDEVSKQLVNIQCSTQTCPCCRRSWQKHTASQLCFRKA